MPGIIRFTQLFDFAHTSAGADLFPATKACKAELFPILTEDGIAMPAIVMNVQVSHQYTWLWHPQVYLGICYQGK